jgi:hypothetical protein
MLIAQLYLMGGMIVSYFFILTIYRQVYISVAFRMGVLLPTLIMIRISIYADRLKYKHPGNPLRTAPGY